MFSSHAVTVQMEERLFTTGSEEGMFMHPARSAWEKERTSGVKCSFVRIQPYVSVLGYSLVFQDRSRPERIKKP